MNDHSTHGRGTDCPCRTTSQILECAEAGCGFCSSAVQDHREKRPCPRCGYPHLMTSSFSDDLVCVQINECGWTDDGEVALEADEELERKLREEEEDDDTCRTCGGGGGAPPWTCYSCNGSGIDDSRSREEAEAERYEIMLLERQDED